MWRIILMVLYSLPFVPYWWYQLCSYAKHTDEIPEDKKYALLKKITVHANKGGRVKIDVHGQENIPREENFVFFPNHQGLFDVLSIIEASDRPFSVVAKIEVKNIFFLKQVFAIMKAKFMDRDDVRQSLKVILSVTDEVKAGRNFLIFPEGTRVDYPSQVRAKSGMAVIAVRTGAVMVPVFLDGKKRLFHRTRLIIGHPVTPVYTGRHGTAEEMQEIADEVLRRAYALGGVEL